MRRRKRRRRRRRMGRRTMVVTVIPEYATNTLQACETSQQTSKNPFN